MQNVYILPVVIELCVYAQMAYQKETAIVFGVITCQLCVALNQKIDFSDSRAVIRYVEHPCTFCSFRVMRVSIHKMVCQKETVMHFWSHNLPYLARMQL